MSDEESHSGRKRMWKINSNVVIVFFLRIALRKHIINSLLTPSVRSLQEISDQGLDVLTSLSLGQYTKVLVWDFPVMSSLSVIKWYFMWRRLRQKNLKTKISHWKHINLLSFHPTQEEFELEFLKTQFGRLWCHRFRKALFSKCFVSTLKRKAGAFQTPPV